MVKPQEDKGWRGILPLHSTRADVEQLLGKPNFEGGRYDYEGERVSIIYQIHTCEKSKGEGWNVPIDTVVRISVSFKNKGRPLSDFPIDWTQYEKTEGGHVIGYVYYTNRDKGISYEAYNDKIVAVIYGATTADAHLSCPDTFKPPKLFSSGDLTAAGQELLNRFMLRLKCEPEAYGMINLNQEYKQAESMRRSVEEYLKRTHASVYNRLAINMISQQDEIELFILLKDRKQPLRFPNK
jgi:hypothetical protein